MEFTAPRSETPDPQLEVALRGSVDAWLAFLGTRVPEIGHLLAAGPDEQDRRGYRHTLREICQQPLTWLETAAGVAGRLDVLQGELARLREDGGPGAIVLTGSGSSEYAGDCLAPTLQVELKLPVHTVSSGEVLLHPSASLPPQGACLLVSFARSGNSPESCGALDSVREAVPGCRHLVITCNRHGRLATSYRDDPRVASVVLDDKTCDRSLVMTSSFTNMVLAGRLLGLTRDVSRYQAEVTALARLGGELLLRHGDGLARLARQPYRSAVYLGSGCRYGSAREAALKMLEMSAGQVLTFPETYLGLRHGPMCAVDDGALVVCFLSRDPVTRAYELDLLRELDRKRLGAGKVLVGHDVPADVVGDEDLVVDGPGLEAVGDEGAPVLDVLIGQLLAFFRCLSLGLRPDLPSDGGVISRVVEDFALHRRG
jgi:tagatose-6-phosphate ketose/aldose isomerase